MNLVLPTLNTTADNDVYIFCDIAKLLITQPATMLRASKPTHVNPKCPQKDKWRFLAWLHKLGTEKRVQIMKSAR